MTASSDWVETKIGNKTAVITLKRSPEGSFTAALRQAYLASLQAAFENPEVETVVLASSKGGFTLDLPLFERQTNQASPSLATLTETISTAPKPVVAALRGRAADAGLELALSASACVAHQGTRISLPSFAAGTLPSPAVLMKLASHLGPERTHAFLASLADMPVTAPSLEPVFAEIVAQNAVGAAAQLAQQLAPNTTKTPAFQEPTRYQDGLTKLRRALTDPAKASEAGTLIEVLEAALLLPAETFFPFAAAHIDDLCKRHESRSKGYRRACKLAAIRAFPEAKPPEALTLVGTSLQASRLAFMALRANLPVRVISLQDGGFTAFRERIQAQIKLRVANRHIPVNQADQMLALLTELHGFDTLHTAEWVVEAAAHSIDAIPDLITELKNATSEQTTLMLTSGMLSGAGEFAEQFTPRIAALQIHADIGGGDLAEIVLKQDYARTDRHKAPMVAALRRLGVPVVFQAAQNGLASTRLLTALCIAAEDAVARGMSPLRFDTDLPCRAKPFAAQNAEGFRAQPFRISAFFSDKVTTKAPSLSATLLKAGIDGGKGTSALEQGTPQLTPEAENTVAAWQTLVGAPETLPAKSPSAAELATAALLKAGFDLLEAGTVQYPWEIDLILTATLGFAPSYGGAFFEAEAKGLASYNMWLKNLSSLRSEFFDASKELGEMVKNGLKFAKPGQPGLAYL